jgi:hypothetical protein
LKGDKGRGLLAHVGLLLSSDGKRSPLGVAHLETVVRRQRKGRSKRNSEERESLRWNRGAQAVYEQLPQAICVMDREADIFALIEEMRVRGQDFVIRAAQNRATADGPLWAAVDGAELIATREVELQARAQRSSSKAKTRFPARTVRRAALEIRSRAVVLRSPNSTRDPSAGLNATSLALNLVQVIEPQPPPGETAVEWILLTSLPIGTTAEVEFVVDSYRARWVIEEFFKALKSGCALEKRQLESVHSVQNVLAVSIPIAWLLLSLRNLSRDEPDSPAATLVSPLMLQALRLLYLQRTHKPLPDELTYKQLTWAIAALGGHIKNNGEPGFLVLGRGMADLIQATDLLQAMAIGRQDVINL